MKVQKEGTIFFFNSTPERWENKIPTHVLMVSKGLSCYHDDDNGSRYFRELSVKGTNNGQLLNCHPSTCPDDLIIIGELPPDQLGATEFKEDYLTTITLVDARPRPTSQPASSLPIGLQFRFRSFPERWKRVNKIIDSTTVFEVVERAEFNGVGQCIRITNRMGNRWNSIDGVLSTDDIDIMVGAGYENAVEWRDKYNETNELLEKAQTELRELKKTQSVDETEPDDCAFWDSSGEIIQKDCGCVDCDIPLRSRLVRFLKRIW